MLNYYCYHHYHHHHHHYYSYSSYYYSTFIPGKLCDASARYERAIQEEPNEIGHHKVTGCNGVSSFMGKLILTKASFYEAINQTRVLIFIGT